MTKFKKFMYILLSLLAILFLGSVIMLQQDVFGARPSGERLERIKKSPNFRDGQFQNLSHTPSLAEGYSYPGVIYDFLFGKTPDRNPGKELPSVKTNLITLPKDQDALIWFGHSSYLILLGGKTFLVDPVFSGHASPFKGMTNAFKGTDVYTVDDLPPIDYLLITHDHYDHLDFETVKKLKSKVGKVICPLGVGSHFEAWNFPPEQLIEQDWGDSVNLDHGITLNFTTARHFSGRSLYRNNTLWTSYVLVSPGKKIFVGGDSGYDTHFAELGNRFGGFDLAILENGQYNEAWRYIHTLPDETLKASADLKAKRTFPVHSSKFALGYHAWHEPLAMISELNKKVNQHLITPMIGEVVDLENEQQVFSNWWEKVK